MMHNSGRSGSGGLTVEVRRAIVRMEEYQIVDLT